MNLNRRKTSMWHFNSSLGILWILFCSLLLLDKALGSRNTDKKEVVLKINGFVGEETGRNKPKKPIAGADLNLEPMKKDAGSNASGKYVFEKIKKGKYKLTVKADRYMEQTRSIDLQVDSTQDFYLWPRNPSKQQCFSVGAKYVDQAKAKTVPYTNMWDRLRADAFPPTFKSWLVLGIDEHDSKAKFI